MKKLHFDTDYMRGACQEIMNVLMETNYEQTPGYGTDEYTARAKELIKDACGAHDAEVFFLVGGTQTNATVIDGLLSQHEGVISAETGHINVHESGAIEATGHKVLTLPSHDGKLVAREIESYIETFYADETYEHMVAPGMVYISHPTEFGTLYTLTELTAISEVCRRKNIPLFMDGARLGYGLAASDDVKLQDIARLCDVFYIGGTKVGALFGEAVVMTRKNLIKHTVPLIKQHGALLAKGRLLGLQFLTLFTDGLYERLGTNGVHKAAKLREGFICKGYKPYIDSPTNQQFFELPNSVIERLQQSCTFELWGAKGSESSVVRFVTDWATTEEDVKALISLL